MKVQFQKPMTENYLQGCDILYRRTRVEPTNFNLQDPLQANTRLCGQN